MNPLKQMIDCNIRREIMMKQYQNEGSVGKFETVPPLVSIMVKYTNTEQHDKNGQILQIFCNSTPGSYQFINN